MARGGKSLKSKLGDPPVGDSLAVVSWSICLLGEMLVEVRDQPGLNKSSRRQELLSIVDRIAKLRDVDRIAKAEEAVTRAAEAERDPTPGPELEADDAARDSSDPDHSPPSRRGRSKR